MIVALALCTLVAAYFRPDWAPSLAIAATSAVVYAWLVKRWLHVTPGYDELHLVRTEDGWTIPLYRYRCDNAKGAVLLVHGIYSTMGLFDVGPQMSLARHLRDQGYDVFCLELRDSDVHGRRSRWYALHKEGACFDDYVIYDLPAAVAHVQKASGKQRISYVGHSMGGMIYYPYAGTAVGAQAIDRAVTLGSMAALPDHRWLRFLPIPWFLAPHIPHYGVRQASAYLLAPLVGLGWLVELFFLNPSHASMGDRRRYFFNGVANSPYALVAQFAQMYRSRSLLSKDGKTDYDALLRNNRVPTLVVAATNDHIASFALVKKGYEALAGEKKWLEMPRFGHNDLVLGWAAKKHVWPQILAWLEAKPATQLAAQTSAPAFRSIPQ